MSLQEDTKIILPAVQAAIEGKKLLVLDGRERPIEAVGFALVDDFGHYHPIPAEVVKIVDTPKIRQWNSIEEMGNAVNDWFRFSTGNIGKIVAILNNGEVGFQNKHECSSYDLNWLFKNTKHTSNPNISGSWKTSGVEEKP